MTRPTTRQLRSYRPAGSIAKAARARTNATMAPTGNPCSFSLMICLPAYVTPPHGSPSTDARGYTDHGDGFCCPWQHSKLLHCVQCHFSALSVAAMARDWLRESFPVAGGVILESAVLWLFFVALPAQFLCWRGWRHCVSCGPRERTLRQAADALEGLEEEKEK